MMSRYACNGSNTVNTRLRGFNVPMNSPDMIHNGERRAHSRHMADMRVQLLRNDTLPMQLHTVELSMGGMHVECDREQAQLLAPPDIGEGQQFTARVLISVPGLERRTLTLTATVKTVVELGRDRYRVGLHFLRFFGKSHQLLSEFVTALEN